MIKSNIESCIAAESSGIRTISAIEIARLTELMINYQNIEMISTITESREH